MGGAFRSDEGPQPNTTRERQAGRSCPLSDNLEVGKSALDVLASLGFDASSRVESSSDGKRVKGLEPSTFTLAT